MTTSQQPEGLEPCPFCGSTKIDPEGWSSTERSGPACDDCGSSADSIAAWNTRPTPAAVSVSVEELRSIIISEGGGRFGDARAIDLATAIHARLTASADRVVGGPDDTWVEREAERLCEVFYDDGDPDAAAWPSFQRLILRKGGGHER